MNKDKLLKLADHLDTMPPEHFHMGSYFNPGPVDLLTARDELPNVLWNAALKAHPCGTACCIAGEAARIAGKSDPFEIRAWFQHEYGLTPEWTHQIVMGRWSPKWDLEDNPRTAAAALRSAVATTHGDASRWARTFRHEVYPTLVEGAA